MTLSFVNSDKHMNNWKQHYVKAGHFFFPKSIEIFKSTHCSTVPLYNMNLLSPFPLQKYEEAVLVSDMAKTVNLDFINAFFSGMLLSIFRLSQAKYFYKSPALGWFYFTKVWDFDWFVLVGQFTFHEVKNPCRPKLQELQYIVMK